MSGELASIREEWPERLQREVVPGHRQRHRPVEIDMTARDQLPAIRAHSQIAHSHEVALDIGIGGHPRELVGARNQVRAGQGHLHLGIEQRSGETDAPINIAHERGRKRIDPRHQLLRRGEAAEERERACHRAQPLQAAIPRHDLACEPAPRPPGNRSRERALLANNRDRREVPLFGRPGALRRDGGDPGFAQAQALRAGVDAPAQRARLSGQREAAAQAPLQGLRQIGKHAGERLGKKAPDLRSLRGRGHLARQIARRGHLRLAEVKLERELPIRASLEAAAQIHALGTQGEIIRGHVASVPAHRGARALESRLADEQILKLKTRLAIECAARALQRDLRRHRSREGIWEASDRVAEERPKPGRTSALLGLRIERRYLQRQRAQRIDIRLAQAQIRRQAAVCAPMDLAAQIHALGDQHTLLQ